MSLAPLEFKMWTTWNPTNDVVELYELANKLMMKWLKGNGFDDQIKVKPHTQIDEYYEPRLIKCLNKPEEIEELDEEEKRKEEEEKDKRRKVIEHMTARDMHWDNQNDEFVENMKLMKNDDRDVEEK